MDRSLFPEGVEVHHDVLQNVETQTQFHILNRFTNSSVMGIKSGFLVTLNPSNNLLVDISGGSGYTPSGEYVEVDVVTLANALPDYTVSALNYVVVSYTEVNALPLQPHETNGQTLPVMVNRAATIKILNSTQYGNLPATDSNMSHDAKDRIVLIAIITANGTGIALTQSSINNPLPFSGSVFVSTLLVNVTGVTITRLDPTTTTGTGQLTFTNSSKTLTWKAPGDSAGAPVIVSAGGIFKLFSSNGQYIVVSVVAGSIPSADKFDNVGVVNIYTQSVPLFSPSDAQHRAMIGSGTPTAKNPHGLTIDDLGAADATVGHQKLFHSNGIDKNTANSDPTTIQASINLAVTPNQVLLAQPTPMSFYIAGTVYNGLASGVILFTDVTDNNQILYDIYVTTGITGIANVGKREIARYADTAPPPLATVAQLANISDGMQSGTAQITYNDTNKTLSFKAPGDSFGTPVLIPTAADDFIRLRSATTTLYLDVYCRAISGWPTPPVGGNDTRNITIAPALPYATAIAQLSVARVMFWGSADGHLGNGLATSPTHSPNLFIDTRVFGMLGPNDLSTNAPTFDRSVQLAQDQTVHILESDRKIIKLGRKLTDVGGDIPLTPRIEHFVNASNTYTLISEYNTTAYGHVRTYIHSVAGTSGGVVITINARWDGTNWNKDTLGTLAIVKGFIFETTGGGRAQETILVRTSDTPWNDSGWSATNYNFDGVANTILGALAVTGNVSGVAGTFSGAVSGTTGTFSGNVSGVAGTFSGNVSGVAGAFSGAVSGTTGTFSSDLSAATGLFTTTINTSASNTDMSRRHARNNVLAYARWVNNPSPGVVGTTYNIQSIVQNGNPSPPYFYFYRVTLATGLNYDPNRCSIHVTPAQDTIAYGAFLPQVQFVDSTQFLVVFELDAGGDSVLSSFTVTVLGTS